MANMSTTTETTTDEKRSHLLQADAAMASLQAGIEERRDNNLAIIQKNCDALHKCVDDRVRTLQQSVQDESAASLKLIKERREKIKSLCSKLEHVTSEESNFTEEQITEINKQYTELHCGVMKRIYKTTQVSLPQLDSITNSIESLGELQSAKIPYIEVAKCSIEGINIPKGKNSSFTVTLRDGEGRVLAGCVDSIKVILAATGKGKVHLQETATIKEQPEAGNYLVRYSPKSVATYQVTTLCNCNHMFIL